MAHTVDLTLSISRIYANTDYKLLHDENVTQYNTTVYKNISTEVSTIRTKAITFKYHQRSEITEDTVEPSFLSEKLISKHTR